MDYDNLRKNKTIKNAQYINYKIFKNGNAKDVIVFQYVIDKNNGA